MTKMYLKSYKLEGILPGKVIEEGYPRNDFLLNTKREEEIGLLRSYGISVEDDKEIILFAPTWRESENGAAQVNPEELLDVKKLLEEKIDTNKYQILIKPHQFVYKQLKDLEEYKGLLVPATLDANQIMSAVDILISDYSSIFLDYMALDRPVLFYIPDLDSYKEKRGLDVKPEDLPGPYSNNLVEVAEYINHIDEIKVKYRDAYQEMKNRICRHDDGNVSKRIVDIVFKGVKSNFTYSGNHNKKRLLISCGGLLEMGSHILS